LIGRSNVLEGVSIYNLNGREEKPRVGERSGMSLEQFHKVARNLVELASVYRHVATCKSSVTRVLPQFDHDADMTLAVVAGAPLWTTEPSVGLGWAVLRYGVVRMSGAEDRTRTGSHLACRSPLRGRQT